MIKVFEAFSGVGSQRMALSNLGIEHEVVCIAEIDKYALQSYMAIHGETKNLGDISKINTEDIPDHDLFTYSFPCQDISVAGLGKGLDMGSGTRSGLLWECQKVISVKKPKYLLLENVKNLVGKKHKHNFDKWLEWLDIQGYKSYWQVLNAKDYEVPQNRERVFVVSILGEHKPYIFPQKQELKLRLKDILEDEVDEKYYLDDEKTKKLTVNFIENTPLKMNRNEIKGEAKANRILGIFDTEKSKHQAGSIWDKEQLAPTLDTMRGGWRQPSILIKNATQKGYLEASEGDGIDLLYPDSETRRGRVQKDSINTLTTDDSKGVVIKSTVQKDNSVICEQRSDEGLRFFKGEVSGSLRTTDSCGDKRVIEPKQYSEYSLKKIKQNIVKGDVVGTITANAMQSFNHDNCHTILERLRIRKLTPLECWRLMSFTDEDFYKAQQSGVSNSQLYKQAGNSIVVKVLEGIFRNLLKEKNK